MQIEQVVLAFMIM